jgi:hypothetical protein
MIHGCFTLTRVEVRRLAVLQSGFFLPIPLKQGFIKTVTSPNRVPSLGGPPQGDFQVALQR